jgi:hypothetical protein
MTSILKELIAGGTAGSIGIIIGSPFDVIKVRMQTRAELYPTTRDSFSKILKNEGFFAFYKGMSSPIAAQFLVNSVLFATNSLCMKVLEPDLKRGEAGSGLNTFISGCIGGVVQCLIIVPSDIVKLNIQMDASPVRLRQHGVFHCVRNMWKTEGILGFYKGFSVTALREVPAFGIYFSSYNQTLKFMSCLEEKLAVSSRSLRSMFSTQQDIRIEPLPISHMTKTPLPSTPSIIVAGGVAGILSWLLVYPIDVIKTNIQVAHPDNPTPSIRPSLAGPKDGIAAPTGLLSMGRALYVRHGVRVFFKGLGVTLLRAFPVNAAVFYFYELFKLHLEHVVLI